MIETLNKYGLLFDSIPRGYSNVEMKSVSFSFVTNVVKIYRKLLIYGEVMFCWRKGGKVTILLKYLSPYLIFSLSSNYLEADGMRNGGKGVIVHILFYLNTPQLAAVGMEQLEILYVPILRNMERQRKKRVTNKCNY